MNNIILASKSERRKEILSKLIKDFKIIDPDIDETIDTKNDIEDEIVNLSYKKARVVFDKNKDDIIIAADTVVVIDDEVLTKPRDKTDNINMIKKLNDRIHKVITGLSVISKNKVYKNKNISYVSIAKITDEEIINYVNTKEGLDKAGGYAIQGIFAKFIKKTDGDYYSIMGLPLNNVYEELRDLNIL